MTVWAVVLLCFLGAVFGFLFGASAGDWAGRPVEWGLVGAAIGSLAALVILFILDMLFGRDRGLES